MDTPQQLYDYPDNLFVAGFIGSPAMNFFNAQIIEGGGDLFIDGGSFKVKVPEKRVDALRGYAGKDVIFGLRPEDIHNPDYAPPGIIAQEVEAKVDVTELMGNEIFLYMKTGDHDCIARVDPRTEVSMGDDITVAFNMDNMHVFDTDTEEVIR
ncbi:MAG: Trehalose import ATP-binding protein SugC [Chloroflexi bacterium]|nr:Trehalose import ATP-binding protein SugC [Chloroflexota bacterium]